MLKSSFALSVMQASAALRATGTPANAALAATLDAALQADMASRAAVAAGQAKRATGKAGRPPAITFAVEQAPGPIAYAMGAKAAHATLAAALAKLGAPRGPSVQSLTTILSSRGQWTCLVDTDNGTVAVTVRKATPAEAAKLA